MNGRRLPGLVLALLVLASVGGCALVPDGDGLTGEVVPGEGVTIGQGRFPDGTEWTIRATRSGNDVCTRGTIGGADHGVSCTTVLGEPMSGFGMSSGTDSPTVLTGFYGPQVAALKVEASDGIHDVPLVPVTGLGLGGSGFGFALPPGVRSVAVTTWDASGALIDRIETGP